MALIIVGRCRSFGRSRTPSKKPVFIDDRSGEARD